MDSQISGIVIRGDSEATPEMLDYAKRCVARAKERGFVVLSTDEAGIDAEVIRAVTELDVPCVCLGMHNEALNGGPGSEYSLYADARILDAKSDFERDQILVRNAELVMCIGDSPTIVALYNFAVGLGKDAHLIDRLTPPES